jgi:signal transduction histidine kinase
LAQAKALRASPLAVLATGFFYTGLLVVLRLLSVPSFVTPVPTNNLPLLFYLLSHAPLPIAISAYTWIGRVANQPTSLPTSIHPALRNLARALILVGILIFAVTTIETPLRASSPVFVTGTVVQLLIITAMVMLGRSLRSELDLWLLLALWGWLLEVALITMDSRGNTAGWYSARGLGLVSGLFVLFTLIAESSRLYGQSVQELEDQDHERERRFLIREAIGASIAHEVRQPLAAILINAQAARMHREVQSADLRETIDDIIDCCRRANDTIQSTRATLGGKAGEKRPVDLEALVRRALDAVSRKARARRIAVTVVVDGVLKPVAVDPAQIQQTLLNLFENAISALTYVNGRARTLEVRCIARSGEEHVTIRVEDNGPGIAPDDRKKIFTPFFTTRKRGTGLGLMIASLVLEAHGGKIGVEPRSPFGTAFVIQLPYGAGRSVVAPERHR